MRDIAVGVEAYNANNNRPSVARTATVAAAAPAAAAPAAAAAAAPVDEKEKRCKRCPGHIPKHKTKDCKRREGKPYCYTCGERGHYSHGCPLRAEGKPIKCTLCKWDGHLAKACNNKWAQQRTQKEQEKKGDDTDNESQSE